MIAKVSEVLGFVLFAVGGSALDSKSMVIPVVMVFGGLALMVLGINAERGIR